MKASKLLLSVLVCLVAIEANSNERSDNPSVEILGVRITRGMPESEARDSLPVTHCSGQSQSVEPEIVVCEVSDGVPPGADGEITFQQGVVRDATRNWFIPEGAEPLEVLLMLNEILTRLTGEGSAACAKIETWSEQEPAYTIFALPEKVLAVQMHTWQGRSTVLFRESLRINPVPNSYKARGKKMQGTEWCGYVN